MSFQFVYRDVFLLGSNGANIRIPLLFNPGYRIAINAKLLSGLGDTVQSLGKLRQLLFIDGLGDVKGDSFTLAPFFQLLIPTTEFNFRLLYQPIAKAFSVELSIWVDTVPLVVGSGGSVDNTAAIGAIQSTLAALVTAQTAMQSDVDGLQTGLTSLASGQTTQGTQLTALATGQTNQGTQLTALATGLTSLTSGQSAIAAAVVALSNSEATSNAAIEASLEAIQTALNAAPVAGYEAETTALLARFSGTYSTARKTAIDTLIKALKTANLLSTMDALWVFAAPSQQDANLNWISNNFAVEPYNSPSFTSDLGYQTNGTTNYLNTRFNPVAQTSKYTKDSATVGFYTQSTTAGDGIDVGASTGNAYLILKARNPSTGLAVATINGSGGGIVTATVATPAGLTVTSRTSNTLLKLYKNGSLIGTDSNNSSLETATGQIYLGARNDSSGVLNPIARSFQMCVIASGWNDTQHTAFANAITVYLTSLGAN